MPKVRHGRLLVSRNQRTGNRVGDLAPNAILNSAILIEGYDLIE